jgi:hypothetical protein
VIRFNPPRIFFGNSLEYPMPSNKATPVKKWIHHMLTQSGREIGIPDISIFPLETGMQEDSDSCGLFALNTIGIIVCNGSSHFWNLILFHKPRLG